VAHIWFLKSLPSKIGAMLDMTLKQLERILYFESYAVVASEVEALPVGSLLSEEKYRQALEEYPGKFKVGIGAEAIREMLGQPGSAEAIRGASAGNEGDRLRPSGPNWANGCWSPRPSSIPATGRNG
jgi:DNA-directed RNA polymerase beta' subunit